MIKLLIFLLINIVRVLLMGLTKSKILGAQKLCVQSLMKISPRRL